MGLNGVTYTGNYTAANPAFANGTLTVSNPSGGGGGGSSAPSAPAPEVSGSTATTTVTPTVKDGVASVTFDADAFGTISGAASGSVTVSASRVDVSALPPQHRRS